MIEAKTKKVSELFKDFEQNLRISDCFIKEIKIAKNINEVFIIVLAEQFIHLKEIFKFEKFLNERFKFSNSNIKVEYVVPKEINAEEQWSNVLIYLGNRNPFAKKILEQKSDVTFEDNVINVVLKAPGLEYLKSQQVAKMLKRIYKNFFGIEVEFKLSQDLSKYTYEQIQTDEIEKKIKQINKQMQEDQNNTEVRNEVPQKSFNKNEYKQKKSFKHVEPEDGEPLKIEGENILFGRAYKKKMDRIDIKDITFEENEVYIKGRLLNAEFKKTKSGKVMVMFDIYDGTSSISAKTFLAEDVTEKLQKTVKGVKEVGVYGRVVEDSFNKEVTIMMNFAVKEQPIEVIQRKDDSPEKRVELHMHTNMSQMDAITPVQDLINRAISWGMDSIAITDHGVVQAFPDAHKMLGFNNDKIKVIYGVEAYLVPDEEDILIGDFDGDMDETCFCVLDLETTGFSAINERITEIGIMKVKNGQVIDRFETFVNPQKPIPDRVVEVTNINDEMVKNAPTIEEIFPQVLEFIQGSVLVAHNASFDIGFLKQNARRLGYDFDYTYLDTLQLARAVYPEFKTYKLGRIAKNLGIEVLVAHRALDDVDTTVKILREMFKELKKRGAKTVKDISKFAYTSESISQRYKKLKSYHAIILAKNYVGLKNLYKLISYSHVDYFYRNPRILRSLFDKFSEGLILGSACEAGELYQAVLMGRPDDEIEKIAKGYDYLEIQPLGNNDFLIRNGTVESRQDLIEINKKIVEIGDKLGKKVVATCDVHFMDPQDEIYRRILEAGQKYDDADNQAPLYLRTTQEMLDEFQYLGEEKAYEVVVTNTKYISSLCEKISPISSEKCAPHIPGCEETIKEIAYTKAHDLYGEELPAIVKDRLDKELDSIINNGFSVMYIIAQKLVWKSNEDGYLVGSRGSVGSSFVAYMTGITEVNSLKAHYRCPKCKHSDFSDYGFKNGFDLPDKDCPICGERYVKDGMDIPFETFLGFNGDKEPDIDLNFSGEYQAKAHKYTEVIFGDGTTFKAGTVGTIADKTAYGYVKGYYEDKGKHVNSAEIKRIAVGCTGIKRTTGQHPGGIIVVPKGREIYEFCPVQHPADDPDSDIITTHFDYHSIDQNLLKLDILGHDDPTMIRMLQDITGVKPEEIPLDDKETMSIFSSTKALGVTPDQINSEVGSYGIPEFGTGFTRGMLLDTRPTTFEELIRISGLSHGTDVWLGNAQTLIQNNVAQLSETICTRDDIMIYLISKGLPPNDAFKIMENVRKGKVAKGKVDNWEDYYVPLMKEHDVPDWYIDSCKKIKYMFPKAHAAAYVMMAFRIAWFKVHIPLAYYAAYFSIRADDFNADIMIRGKERLKEEMERLNSMETKTAKDKNTLSISEIVLEFYERGFKFLNVDIYKSDATKFKIEGNAIRPSLCSIAGLGETAGKNIEIASKENEFLSIQDLKQKAKIGDAIVDLLKSFKCLEGLSETNQLSLFDTWGM